MRVGANSNAVLGTIHGDGAEEVYERVVSDLGVEPSSFAATDLVVTVQSYRTADGNGRRVARIEEVIGSGDDVRFEPLYALEGERAVPTGRIDRGESRLVEQLADPTETYADVRRAIQERTDELARLADDGRINPRTWRRRTPPEASSNRWGDDRLTSGARVGLPVGRRAERRPRRIAGVCRRRTRGGDRRSGRLRWRVAVGILSVPLVLTPLPEVVVIGIVICLAVSVVHGIHTAPHLAAAFRRTEALGDTPNLIGRAVLRMQVQPSLESAVRFAAETGHGPLSASLSAHVDRSMGTPRTGLLTFADEWSDQFPALRRSAHLLATAQEAPEAERVRTLDRSLTAILNGTRNRMADFTSAIRNPTTALFAFGVMLPLALVALVPAVPMAGFSVNIWMLVVLYNLVLPIVLVAASVRLLVRRPVAFPPPTVSRDHPMVPDRLWLRGIWGIVAGLLTYVLISRFGPAYLASIAAAGVGIESPCSPSIGRSSTSDTTFETSKNTSPTRSISWVDRCRKESRSSRRSTWLPIESPAKPGPSLQTRPPSSVDSLSASKSRFSASTVRSRTSQVIVPAGPRHCSPSPPARDDPLVARSSRWPTT